MSNLFSYLKNIYFSFMIIIVLPAYTPVHHLPAWCPLNQKDGTGAPGTRITNDGRLTCGNQTEIPWKSNQCS